MISLVSRGLNALLLLQHCSAQKCFLLPKPYEAHCSHPCVGLLRRWNLSVVEQSFLLWAFYWLWYCFQLTAQGEWKFHTFLLSVSLCGEPTKTSPPGSKPTLQAQRFWRLVLDHLKRPVNKAESFRYMPSESETLQRSTDSQRYHCWKCCGTNRKTRADAFSLSHFLFVLLDWIALNQNTL